MKFLIFVIFISTVQSANILYLSNAPSPSHFGWCRALLYSLHARGHNITVLSPDVEDSRENFTFLHLDKTYSTLTNGSKKVDFFEMGQLSAFDLYKDFYDWFVTTCETTPHTKAYQTLNNYPNDFKVDLVIYDFSASSCLLGFVHKFKNPPMLSVTPFMYFWKYTLLSGSQIYPSILPSYMSEYTQKMTFKERVSTTLINLLEFGFEKFIFEPAIDKLVQKHHPDAPSVTEIERKNTKLILVNTDPLTDFTIPSFPNVKLVGGAQIQKPKELPAELKSLADSAKDGLVLFSLGTNVRSDTLGQERILKILKALSRLPKYTFLWKFETHEKLPIEMPKNVRIQSWLPQKDLLAHPNTKLFISHCGVMSTQEGLWFGVPVLSFPVFADQKHNSLRLKNLGVGEILEIRNFTENELYGTIKKLLEDPTYWKNMKRISAALHDKPMTPNEEATYWAEWIMRNPDIELSNPALNLSFIVRHSLDVFALFFAIIVLFCILFIKMCIFFIKYQLKKGKKVDVNKKIN